MVISFDSFDGIKNDFIFKDESLSGVLTILCNHSFHGDCLIKWGDSW
jgi:hypothetical protein